MLGSGSEGVFADDVADPVAAVDAEGVEVSDRCWEGLEWRGLAEAAVRPVLVVVALVLANDVQRVELVPDHRRRRDQGLRVGEGRLGRLGEDQVEGCRLGS